MTQLPGKNLVRSISTRSLIATLGVSLCMAGCFGDSPESLMASARKHIEAKDSKTAVIELKNVLQQQPENAEGRFLLGKLLLDSGEAVSALVELQKAQELGYDPERLNPVLARAMLNNGNAQAVVSTFAGKSLKAPGAQADLQATLAEAYIQLRKPAEAEAAVAAALAASPDHLGARLLQVRRQAGSKDFVGALVALDKVIESAPTDSGARLLKGDLLMQTGQDEAALTAYREAIQRNSANVAAQTAAVWILLSRRDLAGAEVQLEGFRKVAPQLPQVGFFSAAIAFERGDTKAAYDMVQRVLRVMPDDPTVLQLAGALELNKGQFRQAEAHLSKALQAAPDRPRVRLLLAQAHLRSGEAVKAMKVLQPLVDASPPEREALPMMAHAYLVNGDSAKAEQFYKRAAALNPKDTRSRTALALAEVAKGRAEEGLDSLREISATDAGMSADLALISAHLRRNEVDAALKAIAQLQTKQRKSPLVAELRGRAELLRGNAKDARAAFEQALGLNPAYYPAAGALVSLDLADGKRDQARQRMEAFAKAYPDDSRAALSLARLRTESGVAVQEVQEGLTAAIRANPTDAALRVALIDAMLAARDFKGGLAAAQDGLNVLRDNTELLDALGRAQFLSSDYNQAVGTFKRLASLAPASPEPLMRLADIHRARKDLAAATTALRKALEVKPNYVPAQEALMALDLSVGKRKEALATARAIQRQPGNEAVGFSLEGDLEWSGKNWAAAANAYRQSLARRPSPDIAIKLHSSLLRAGQTDAAAKVEPQWLAAPAFLFYLGDVALKKQQFDVARQHFAAVVQAKPDSAPALNNLAWLLARESKPGALEMAQKAVALSPREPAFLDTLAEILAKKGDMAKAVAVQTTAVDLAPNLPTYRLHLASYHLGNNDKTKARAELDRLAALGDKFSGQAEVKALQARL